MKHTFTVLLLGSGHHWPCYAPASCRLRSPFDHRRGFTSTDPLHSTFVLIRAFRVSELGSGIEVGSGYCCLHITRGNRGSVTKVRVRDVSTFLLRRRGGLEGIALNVMKHVLQEEGNALAWRRQELDTISALEFTRTR